MAGTSMKDIRLRIRSVESTLQITKAMQLVATSKLRKARERMENSRPFTNISREAVAAAVQSCDDPLNPYIHHPAEGGKTCYVVIAGERGLAGGYNANVFRAVEAHARGGDYCVLPLGKKAVEKYDRLGAEILSREFVRVEGFSVGQCYALSRMLTGKYLAGEFSRLFIVYTSFASMLSQNVQAEQLLPLPKAEKAERAGAPVSTIFEPGAGEALSLLVPDLITGRLYSAVCDSYVSEVASRRSAMDSATKNAEAMISELTLRFNRARQGAITQEITEIVAGAEE